MVGMQRVSTRRLRRGMARSIAVVQPVSRTMWADTPGVRPTCQMAITSISTTASDVGDDSMVGELKCDTEVRSSLDHVRLPSPQELQLQSPDTGKTIPLMCSFGSGLQAHTSEMDSVHNESAVDIILGSPLSQIRFGPGTDAVCSSGKDRVALQPGCEDILQQNDGVRQFESSNDKGRFRKLVVACGKHDIAWIIPHLWSSYLRLRDVHEMRDLSVLDASHLLGLNRLEIDILFSRIERVLRDAGIAPLHRLVIVAQGGAVSILSPGQGLRTRAKRTTGKQGLRYTPRPGAPHYYPALTRTG
jgi:hypothetical protein